MEWPSEARPPSAPARRSPRSIRSPAPNTRSAASGASAWRSPTRPSSPGRAGGRRTRRRCATPGICAATATIPGPPAASSKAWRRLGAPGAMQTADWTPRLATLLELRRDDALEEIVSVAAKLAKGQGSAVAAAAEIAAVSLRLRPDAEALALWLADAVLAHRLNWPAPVPMIAGEIRRSELRAAGRHGGVDSAWLAACALAYARAAAAAVDLYAELARRAERLLAVAPQLRGRDADLMIAILIGEDAQAARTGKTATDRSSRRLFDRLVALGAVRELTGRPTFRLYGL